VELAAREVGATGVNANTPDVVTEGPVSEVILLPTVPELSEYSPMDSPFPLPSTNEGDRLFKVEAPEPVVKDWAENIVYMDVGLKKSCSACVRPDAAFPRFDRMV
jgi:hypothetical protein